MTFTIVAYKDIFAITCVKTSAVFFVIAVYYATGIGRERRLDGVHTYYRSLLRNLVCQALQ